MECDIGDAMASIPQSRNQLEDRRGKYDKMSRQVWKAVENKGDEARVAEAEEKEIKEREGTKRKSKRI